MLSFNEFTRRFTTGEASPVDFLNTCIENINQREEEVKAFEYLNIEGAVEHAELSEQRWLKGEQLSSVDGMPIAVKDIIETRDMPTQYGSPYFTGHHSHRDSAAVTALRSAGAIIIGKSVTTEFAASHPGKTRNPWNTSHTPGGSSSGSAAAVSSGMVPVALGTQVIGSIIRPASYCGTFAIKPTVGTVNRGGSHDGLSQSAHGVLSATLEDGWNVLREVVSRVGGDPGYQGLDNYDKPVLSRTPKRIGVLKTAGYDVAEHYAWSHLEEAAKIFRQHGIEVVNSNEDTLLQEIEEATYDAQQRSLDIVNYECIWPMREYLNQDATKLSEGFRQRIEVAEQRTPEEYGRLIDERQRARKIYEATRGRIDAFITLSATGVAPKGLDFTGNTVFNTAASYLGVPAVNLPLFTEGGLPLGLQVIGFQRSDFELVGLAHKLAALHSSRG